jgi:hypothetical protein
MSEKPISPLRRRMIEDMSVRNFVEKTRNDYIRHVRTFTAFLGRSPDTAIPPRLRICAVFNCIRRRPAYVRRASTVRLRRCASSSP